MPGDVLPVLDVIVAHVPLEIGRHAVVTRLAVT